MGDSETGAFILISLILIISDLGSDYKLPLSKDEMYRSDVVPIL